MTKIKTTFSVTTFKPSGKYYDEFDLELEVSLCSDGKTIYMDHACEQAKLKRGQSKMYWLLNHPEGYPCLLTP